jgi:hypothetical protein
MMQRKDKDGGGELYVGYDSIILFVAAALSMFVLVQYFQRPDMSMDLFFIALIQLMMGIAGFMLGYMISKDEISITYPTRKRINETYGTGSVYAAIVMLLNTFVVKTQSGMVAFETGFMSEWNVPLTAAIVEDAFFSLFIAILFYKTFKKMFRDKGSFGDILAILFASIFTGVFFMMIHMNVYGRQGLILFLMMFNRIIYTVVFLKHRNFSMVVWMHMAHNILALLVG